ncbi:MAG: lectin, partial [Hyphomicrobiales bacterium]
MIKSITTLSVAVIGFAAGSACAQSTNVQHPMGFFVTSAGLGDGGNLGGLDGADAHCQSLAEAAGAGNREWRAYLSTQEEGKRGISARSRIGQGPWYNADGELIASDLDQLHILPNIFNRTAVDENGNPINGRGDSPNEHDILTGTQEDGTAYFPWQEGDKTCSNWT